MCAVVFFFAVSSAKAQYLELGFSFAPSVSSLRGNEIIKKYHNPVLAYAFGPTVNLHFNNKLALSSGLFLEQKATGIHPEENAFFRANFDYISLPLMARYSFGHFVKYYINAGPYFNYLLQETSFFASTINPEDKSSATNQFHRRDIGLSTGIGLRMPIDCNIFFNAELRHNYGLTNISKLPVVENGKIQTNSTNLLIGFTCYL